MIEPTFFSSAFQGGGILIAGVLLAIQTLLYLLGKALVISRDMYRFNTAADEKIPFLPWTGLIYLSAFVYWILGFASAITLPGFYIMAAAQILCCLLSFAIFLLFPTRMAPPPIPKGAMGRLLEIIRLFDSPPVNLMPSMHCTVSWLCFLASLGAAPGWWQVICFFWSILIFASTLTTKQHDIADVLVGVVLAQLCWLICSLLPALPQLAQVMIQWILPH